jgi:hypothetical protein
VMKHLIRLTEQMLLLRLRLGSLARACLTRLCLKTQF